MKAAGLSRSKADRQVMYGRAGAWGAVVLAVVSGCTVADKVIDDPAGNEAANVYVGGPSERSLSLWSDPGDNLLAALTEVEASDADDVLPANNRVLGSLFGETGSYFSATTTYTPFSDALESQGVQCESAVLPDAIEGLCASIVAPRKGNDGAGPEQAVQLVLVNELPHVAYQRSLVRKLLQCAWDAGFRYLGVEALQEDDAALEARGHVSRSASGHFTREPQLSRLLDDGMRLGYDIVSYEVPNPCDNCRRLDEIKAHAEQQAANLVAKTFAVDPAAKVLVLTSARQAYKRIWGIAPYTKSLGAYLWDQTSIEPFSIEQVPVALPTLQFGASPPDPASGMYVASGATNGRCMGTYTPASPMGKGLVDAVVIHVPPHSDAERWDWLHTPAEERRSVTATCATCAAGEHVLVQAFPAGIDRTDRVPVDQAVCVAGEPCQMSLPAASYDVVVWSEGAMMGTGAVDLQGGNTATVAL